MSLTLTYEYKYIKSGYLLGGIDEAGRGALAGPVVASIVLVDKIYNFPGVNDSKLCTALQRQRLFDLITQHYAYGIGIVWPDFIDKYGIRKATYLAMLQAYWNLNVKPDMVLVDGVKSVIKLPISNTYYFVHGDAKVYSIAMASILAKVTRDRIMDKLHKEYPKYKWNKNKGYGTLEHRKAIMKYGKSAYHRRTFLSKILHAQKTKN